MYKIYKNGLLYKTTESVKCVERIIEKFLNSFIPYTNLVIEKNGEIIFEYNTF